MKLAPEQASRFFDQFARRFVDNRGYQTIAGRPLIAVLNLPDFQAAYGTDGLALLMSLLRARVEETLGIDPFLVGLLPDGKDASIDVAARMPCDAITGYGLLPDWAGPPLQRYEELLEQRVAEWYRIQRRISVPFFPVVCVGWDASRRGAHISDLRSVRSFPWRPIIVGSNPAAFGVFLDEAERFLDATDPPVRCVYIHAWNEWSEGSAVEPGTRWSDDFLKEIEKRNRIQVLTM
ncbi:glycosyl transferase family WbsX [Asanoa ferruginea]|uniref:Glycosyl transferase family WbsX n=1 Tax=Asanoa ferruginea TaxID=53367 RepID=A0A3D9ZUG3_9ACTN|nr:glycoside hydrolase family 99-like domain-containing protein [Asanoa ferruginea]REG01017.1 glycosyl transferase family WbsX [Asanoa ferruginea]